MNSAEELAERSGRRTKTVIQMGLTHNNVESNSVITYKNHGTE